MRIIFFKNALISERKSVILYIGIGLRYYLYCTLNILIFCNIQKFLCLSYTLRRASLINLRNLNNICVYSTR